jgi:hypothetical protein
VSPSSRQGIDPAKTESRDEQHPGKGSMTIRRRHVFLDFIAILAVASWSKEAGAQASGLVNQLGAIARSIELSCVRPDGPQRPPHRPRRDEARSRAPHLRRPVRSCDAVVQEGPRPG